MHMRKSVPWLFVLGVLIASLPGICQEEAPATEPPSLFDLDLEQLMDIEFYTSSRTHEDIRKIASVVTIVTKEQIEQEGLKDLNEVLKRVPGFFVENGNSVQSFITHRGIRTDQNVCVLVLIDGHPQNVNSVYGVNSLHLFPLLANVERIEITRDPNSTMWGSDAATAVINIITKDGTAIDPDRHPAGRLSLSLDYEFRDRQRTASAVWGKQFADGDLMLSYTNIVADGDPEYDYRPTAAGPAPVDTRWKPYAMMPESHDLYLKGRLGDFALKLGYSDLSTGNGQNSSYEAAKGGHPGRRRTRRAWGDVSYTVDVNDYLSNETRVFFDRRLLDHDRSGVPNLSSNWWKEQGYGIENISRYARDDWSGLLGFSYQTMRYKHSRSMTTTLDIDGREEIKAAFGEVGYNLMENLKLTVGGRLEESDLRSDGTNFAPRAGIVYGLSDLWTARYSYSTGIVRPQREYNVADQGWIRQPDGSYLLGTHEPLSSETHELQVVFRDEMTSFGLTLFHVNMKDLFTFSYTPIDDTDKPIPGDPAIYRVFYASIDSVTSYGLELEWEHRFNESWRVYGNATCLRVGRDNDKLNAGSGSTISFADTTNQFYDSDDKPVAVPEYMWNLGVDYLVMPKVSLNLHYRGWGGYKERYSSRETRSQHAMHFVDINLTVRDVLDGMKMAFYVKNALDARYDDVFLANNPGREIGVSLSFRF
ncbi:MAG: TonB-dependent receptor [Lentisphaeria bacterium]|nr:TonB-dependent receptor [Lentisphaeria bacterium]